MRIIPQQTAFPWAAEENLIPTAPKITPHLLDWIKRQAKHNGCFRGGRPMKAHWPASDLGVSIRTINRALLSLRARGEIRTWRTPAGLRVEVCHQQVAGDFGRSLGRSHIRNKPPVPREVLSSHKSATNYKSPSQERRCGQGHRHHAAMENQNRYDWQADWELFFALFPHNPKKEQCRQEFRRVCVSRESAAAIMAGLRAYLASKELARGVYREGQNWLAARMWEGKWAPATGSTMRQETESERNSREREARIREARIRENRERERRAYGDA